jgi:hypothetical protein
VRCPALEGWWVVKRRSRLERAEQLETATARLAAGQPQRQVAADLGLARSTLQDWRKPVAVGAAPAALAAWVETPEGVRWLHQLLLAAHFTITLQGGAGVRVVCQFLELSGLSAFVGASYGAHQGLNAALEEALVAVACEQRAALAQGMPHRDLTVCEDETFHPQICLVALEPSVGVSSAGAVRGGSYGGDLDAGPPGGAGRVGTWGLRRSGTVMLSSA